MKQLGQIAIGRYQLQGHLARGGMADIYLAHDIEKDQTVAIKLVHENAGEYCERFQREVKIMAGLTHDHILPAYDYGEYESWYFLVTPYIEYGTLSTRLADGPLLLEEVDVILDQLTQALQFAHEQGIVHRDIKPSNILMRDGEHVYLADFGLVKRVGQENGLTVTGYLIGTPEYMAPELAEEDASPQSDVYALGVLLYQMLAGRVPFKANTPMGVYLRHIRDIPEPPSAFNPAIPPQVEHVILRAMEKDPQKRYRSAQELHAAYALARVEASQKKAVVADRTTQMPGILIPRSDVRVVRPKIKMSKPLLAALSLAALLLMSSSMLLNFASPAVEHASGGKHKTSTSLRKNAGSYMNASASDRQPTSGVNDKKVTQNTMQNTVPASRRLQDINSANGARNTDAQGDTDNGAGQESINPLPTADANGERDTLGQGGNTDNTSSQGTGSGNGGGNSGTGQNTGGSGGGQGNGNSGTNKGGQGNGNSGNSGSGQGNGNSGTNKGGQGNGNSGNSGGGQGNDNGQGNQGDKGKGNGNGEGNGKGNGGGD